MRLHVYPTRRAALSAAYRRQENVQAGAVLKSPHRRPPFHVISTADPTDHEIFTSRTAQKVRPIEGVDLVEVVEHSQDEVNA